MVMIELRNKPIENHLLFFFILQMSLRRKRTLKDRTNETKQLKDDDDVFDDSLNASTSRSKRWIGFATNFCFV